jgi:hypothetical protein
VTGQFRNEVQIKNRFNCMIKKLTKDKGCYQSKI